MKRIYDNIIPKHFVENRQMLFFIGPRQVGKTTTSLTAKALSEAFLYLNWDDPDSRNLLAEGTNAIYSQLGLNNILAEKGTLIFDEIHKLAKWKNYLKGFYDKYHQDINIIATGSAKINIYRKAGDSMMGRYLPYRIHPFSVAEYVRTDLTEREIVEPSEIENDAWESLQNFGGFPAPFLRASQQFATRWKGLIHEQLFRGDIRELTNIREMQQLEMLAELLKLQAGQLLNYSSLAKKLQISVDTVKRWCNVLTEFYYGFMIKPWSRNLSRSLIKNPRFYLWDWSTINDEGSKLENLVACHLLKAVHFWTDCGFGNYDLFFLRDKEQREVDFLVTKNDEPWFMVEVKKNAKADLNANLAYFKNALNIPYAFQVAMNMPYIDENCFNIKKPTIVPAKTLLSQLV